MAAFLARSIVFREVCTILRNQGIVLDFKRGVLVCVGQLRKELICVHRINVLKRIGHELSIIFVIY